MAPVLGGGGGGEGGLLLFIRRRRRLIYNDGDPVRVLRLFIRWRRSVGRFINVHRVNQRRVFRALRKNKTVPPIGHREHARANGKLIKRNRP